LGRIAPQDKAVADSLFRLANEQVSRNLNAEDRIAVLRACQALDGVGPFGLTRKLRAVAMSFKWDNATRQQALLACAHAEPTTEALIAFLTGLFDVPVHALADAPARALVIVVERCRRRVEDVRKVFGSLKVCRDTLVAKYDVVRSSIVASLGEAGTPAIREALEDVSGLLVAYREFSERVSLDFSEPNLPST
jgi:hypothetical protein